MAVSGVEVGAPLPEFDLPATGDQRVSPARLLGARVVLYFYPKDNTPGCTTEGQNFRDAMAQFEALGARIYGISRDSVKSHEGFRSKQCFPFDLISDEDGSLCRLFDVLKEKNMYGKKVLGIERSTFLVDERGVLRREWRKVKVDGHVEEVLAAVRALES